MNKILHQPLHVYLLHPASYLKILNRRIVIHNLKNRVNKTELTRSMLYSGKTRAHKIIVSLTSYPGRFAVVDKAIKSVMLGSMKPNRIILFLSKDEVPDITFLPESIKDLQKYGLEIELVEGNLMPHNKYFYVAQKINDELLITVDDDIYYPKDLVKSLYKSYLKHPDCVNARRCHLMQKTYEGSLIPYDNWEGGCTRVREPNYALFATGVGGVLYPPSCMDKELFDEESIKKYCLKADDVWLKAMQLKKGIKVVWVPNKMLLPPQVEDSQKKALMYSNCAAYGTSGANNLYIANMKQYFNIDFVDYAEVIPPPVGCRGGVIVCRELTCAFSCREAA